METRPGLNQALETRSRLKLPPGRGPWVLACKNKVRSLVTSRVDALRLSKGNRRLEAFKSSLFRPEK